MPFLEATQAVIKRGRDDAARRPKFKCPVDTRRAWDSQQAVGETSESRSGDVRRKRRSEGLVKGLSLVSGDL